MTVALPARPHDPLPLPRDLFVNRAVELRAVRDLLADPQVPLLALTGPAGVGKSRLALQAADRLRDRYLEGIAFVPCSVIADPDRLPAAIARAIGLPEGGEGPLFARLVDHLRRRQLLLLLDNLEHLDGCGPVLADLLRACPGVQALVTSRGPLHLAGERDLPVPPLPVPVADAAPRAATLAANESVALFVVRARAVNPAFDLTDRIAGAVAEIVRRLDGLPLAIELAAARAKALSVWEMLDQLERTGRLALLDDGPRDQPERLRSLRSAVAWSYDLLPASAQTLFRRLAICPGGWDLEGAQAIPGGRGGEGGGGSASGGGRSSFTPFHPLPPPATPSVLAALTALLDHGLVQRVERPCREARYAMLETIREFAVERLETAGERADAERRQVGHALAVAEAAAGELNGPDQASWLQRLEAELPNFRAVLARLLAAGELRLGLRLVAALGPFWRLNGHVDDARWLHAFLKLAEAAPEDPSLAAARAAALRWAGEIAGLQGDARTAVALLTDSLARCRALGDRAGATAAAGAMGVALVMRGTPEAIAQSIPCLEEAIALHRELGDDRRAAFLQVYLGYAVGHRSDPVQGARLVEAAEADACYLGDGRRAEVGIGLLMRGWLALVAGDRERARALLEECLELADDLGSIHAQAGARAGLGWAALATGDRGAATRHFRGGLDLAGRVGYRLGIAINLQGIVRLAVRAADRRRVARLAGAVESLGGVGRLLLTGPLLEAYEEDVALVCAELGKRTFEAEHASGLRLRLELVVAEGLALVEATEDRAISARAGGTSALPRLTPKETDVLRLLEKRLANREIAGALGLSTRTVETHVQHVCGKLATKGRRAAVERAHQLGML